MSFSIIAAIASNNVIGKDNKLPWHIPDDLEHFYKTIYGKPVVAGRKTYESIGTPIKNSQNIVLSHNPALKIPGCKIVNSITDVLNSYPNDYEVMIIGGASIYHQFLPLVNKMYLTLIDQEFEGDSYFPKWHINNWQIIDESTMKSNLYPCRLLILQKIY